MGGLERSSDLSLLQGHLRWLHPGCQEEEAGGGSRKRLAAHSSFVEAVSWNFCRWADLALFMARKYARLALVTALRDSEERFVSRKERLDWWRRTAA